MKIAITGATGQLGNLVIEQLLQLTAAQNIVALVRNVDKAEHFKAKVLSFVSLIMTALKH
jgi:NAD(P)H dehydrogenase (quinone)